ncbi:amino acid transporter [Papiliotrema laurentii]|uniref:Amino acid transporter n=1 Tax=Papiliotrema laurentii TaxID=5418 RepID=A0AAD9FLP2_PAPLA|nr:amino acid transporter [Papiliotrema laurentii]
MSINNTEDAKKSQLAGQTTSLRNVEIGGNIDETVELEHVFGYEQALPRTKTFGNMMMMMVVLSSVPFGIGTTFYYSLVNGGAMVAFWGWIIMSLITVCIAVSLGEIASRYPVSGGTYYWSFMLSPPKWAPLVSWIVGWLSVIGNMTVTLTANFGTTQLILASVNIFYPDYVAAQWHTVLCSWALILILGSISILGQKYLPHVDTFCIIWIFAGVLATAITLPIKANAGRRSASYVFTEFVSSGTGWPTGWSFILGLIQGAYCLSPTGMLASMAEEVKHPEINIPRAMTYGIMFNGAFGLVFLLPILFTLGDLETILASVTGQPVPEMYLQATGSRGAAFGLFFIVLVNGLVCGLACSQAASRCIWAFARDGGLPGSRWFGKASKRHGMPLNAFFLNVAVQVALTCLYFGSTAAFNAFIGVAVICLGSSYLVPIAISFFRGRTEVKYGRFYKGKLGAFCNVVAICWYIFALPLLSFPTAIPVTKETMNYASAVFVGFAAISVIWYIIYGKKHYKGPPITRIEHDVVL